MPNPLAAAGATSNPTRYAALTQAGRDFTGLVTQRSPYRDGAVPYLVAKFYGGSRFDTIIDGLNREITVALTDKRSPGSSVFNANTFPAIASFAKWKYNQNGSEIVRTLADGTDGKVYDATPGQKSTLLAKSAGAGAALMLGVNTELFIGDGVDQKKVLRSAKTWQATEKYNIGDFIIDSNGNIQAVLANPVSYAVTSTEVIEDAYGAVYVVITLSTPAPVIPANQTASFSGLTGTGAFLNGVTLEWQGTLATLNLTPSQIAFPTFHATYAPSASSGTMVALTATSGTSGGTQPTWSSTWGAVTADAGVNWTCFASPVQNWGITSVPYASPDYGGPMTFLRPGIGDGPRYWSPALFQFSVSPRTIVYSILDPNSNVQVVSFTYTGNPPAGGAEPPTWTPTLGAYTTDNQLTWLNYGRIASAWYATTNYGGFDGTTTIANPCVILDSNGNLQGVQSIPTAGTSGSTVPTWATTAGTTTTDGTVTWVCLGPGSVLWSGTYQYAWSPVGIDGTVGTASPITLVANGGLGPTGGFKLTLSFSIAGTSAVTDQQVKSIKLWRTAQGKTTLIQLDEIPNPWLLASTTATYIDVSSDLQLNAFISAPVAESADPPPVGYRPCCFALQRIWGVVDNRVVYSQGPDAVTGNGLTQFAPLNEVPFIGKPYDIFPITVQGGGQVVFTSSGIQIIMGSGTALDPFYARPYFDDVSVTGYNAVTRFNQNFYVVESNLKISSVAIEFPFNPQGGYFEIGQPIGDQFQKVTTGGISASLYTASNAFISWNNQNTQENALYVADGAVGWFRVAPVASPESGFCWSPRRAIAGGTSAVQAVETAPGVTQLLIGPASSGPILCRDASVYSDNGTLYDAYDTKGVNLLCSTGQWAETAHISAKSAAVGARPVVSVLLNEIAAIPGTDAKFSVLKVTGPDPVRGRKSKSVFSDRYNLAQNGIDELGDCILTRFDYGAQAVADELLDWGIFASVHDEREEGVAK